MTECEQLHKSLDDLAKKIDLIYSRYKIGAHEGQALLDVSLTEEMQEFKRYFLLLYNESIIKNYFWQYCSLNTYKLSYKQRLEDYLKAFAPDATENDFIKNEKQLIIEKNPSSDFPYFYPKESNYKNKVNVVLYDFDKDIEIRNKIKFTQEKKMMFLEEIEIQLKERSEKQETEEPEIFLDYSDSTQAERIVFLKELGILDYLQDKINKELHGFSVNKLAEVISTFTEITQTTAQSYLNPMYSKSVDQKNNPLTNNNLKDVKEKLIKIGFINPQQTNSTQ